MADYVLSGTKWGPGGYGTSGGVVTWSFAALNYSGYFISFEGLLSAPMQSLVRSAFDRWETVVNINFVEVVESASASIRLGMDSIDGSGSTIGEARWSYFFGGAGEANHFAQAEIRFDNAEGWYLNSVNQIVSSGGSDFFALALHEIGHAIGLDHAAGNLEVMNAISSSSIHDLFPGDIAGGRAIYGTPGAKDNGDFNGDARADVLWRGQAGEVTMWQMSGSQVAASGNMGNPGVYWTVADTGDFNGDGRADILWRGLQGEVTTWQMSGSQVAASGNLGNPGAYWTVANTGDFNGDGRADILWRGERGEATLWQMDGAQVLSSGNLGNPGTYWTAAGTGDFNGDGRADILWRGQKGEVTLWQMNGSQVLANGNMGNPGTYWAVAGTGDFNGDGRDDVLWRGQKGEVTLWQMNGAQVAANRTLANPGSYWTVADTDDFNGDGRADILWRGQNGEVGIWQMNGSQIIADGGVSNPGNYWQIVA